MALRRLEGRLEKRRFSMLDIALGIWVAVSLFGMWYLLSSPSAKQQQQQQQQQQQGGSVENEGGSGTYALQQSRLSPSLADATAAVSGLRKVRVPLPEAILRVSVVAHRIGRRHRHPRGAPGPGVRHRRRHHDAPR